MTDLVIRQAELAEAEAVADVLRQSIAQLCVMDHHNSASVLDGWLAGKTAATVANWIADPDQTILVCIRGGEIAGVGAASRFSQILLNYVAPAHRFKGVSKALMVVLEGHLAKSGSALARLTSTSTAHQFYLSLGYENDGAPQVWRGGAKVYPMKKAL